MLAELEDATDLLVGLSDGFGTLDDASVEAAVHGLAALRTSVEALWLAALAAAEDRGLHHGTGARDIVAWASSVAGERRGATSRDVTLAGQLRHAPLVAQALAAGAVSKAKSNELVQAAQLPAEAQSQLIAEAIDAPVEQVAASVRRARLEHGLVEPPVTPSLTISRLKDRARLEATVDLVDAEVIDVAIRTAADALALPADTTTAERRARGLVAVAHHFLDHAADPATSRVGRPHVLVMVDLHVLEARTGGTATLASGAVITGDQARRLADDANVSRIMTKGRSEPLDVGRTTRTIPPGLAKAVIARDRHCKYESCTAPVWACDIHHRIPWSRHGPTALSNLGLLCWFHHEHVHRHGADRMTETHDGRWHIGTETRHPEELAA